MIERLDVNTENKWQQLVESHLKFSRTLKEFFSDDIDRVAVLRQAFQRGEIATALYVAPYMPASELTQLFEQLVHISTAHGYAGIAREIILSLPREWVLSNIERTINFLLAKGFADDYRRILELLFELDYELTRKYAQKAIDHPDEEVQEAGQDFLERMGDSRK